MTGLGGTLVENMALSEHVCAGMAVNVGDGGEVVRRAEITFCCFRAFLTV